MVFVAVEAVMPGDKLGPGRGSLNQAAIVARSVANKVFGGNGLFVDKGPESTRESWTLSSEKFCAAVFTIQIRDSVPELV